MKNLERREFFKLTALATGGFMLGTEVNGESDTPADAVFTPNAFIKISSDGSITLIAHMPDMGQGVKTSLPMLIAEELEVDWDDVIIEQAVANEKVYGRQTAGGSQSVPVNYTRLRKLGAAAKEMLVRAAAQEWDVPVSRCVGESGAVKHTASEKVLTYGELATKAAQMEAPNPKQVALKDKKDFKLIGKRIGGVDNKAMVTGSPLYGIDQVKPGMKYASFLRCPVFGGSVKEANLEEVKKMPGVIEVFIVTPSEAEYAGVAVIADSTWQAMKGMEALKVDWDKGPHADQSTEGFAALAEKIIGGERIETPQAGADGQALDVVYHYPHLAHNTLEPQNCTGLFQEGTFEFWSPTQCPRRATEAIAKTFGIKPNQIEIHVTRSGGGFGRRINFDFMVECAAIAKKMAGTPIKLTWTREQDIRHDYYRSAGWHHFKGAVDEEGGIATWADHFVTLGANNNRKPGTAAQMNQGEFPLGFITGSSLRQSVIPSNVPFGWWRAPGSNGISFAVQSFIDELAHAGGVDPLEFRMTLLSRGGPKGRYDLKRMKGALKAATEKAGWGTSLPKGSAHGVAFHYSHRGYAAVVAEVTVSKSGELQVNRLTAGVDVGPILNLSGAESQAQGSMLDGLSAAWYQQVVLKDGAVQNSNFDDYPVLRMPEAPALDVVFVDSKAAPTGLGEPVLPPTIPAVCNAIFAATGKRIRSLPISEHDLSWG